MTLGDIMTGLHRRLEIHANGDCPQCELDFMFEENGIDNDMLMEVAANLAMNATPESPEGGIDVFRLGVAIGILCGAAAILTDDEDDEPVGWTS